MNDEELEIYLREMSPAALPAALLSRLPSPPKPPPCQHGDATIHWLFFAGPPLALAALLLLTAMLDGLSFRGDRPPPPRVVNQAAPGARPNASAGSWSPDYKVFQSVAQRSTLVNLSPGIVVEAGPNRPMRLMKAKWLYEVSYVGDNHDMLHRQTTRTEFIVVAFNAL